MIMLIYMGLDKKATTYHLFHKSLIINLLRVV